MKKLENKVAVVTGGNSGIGLAIAQRFAKEGAKLVLFGRNADTLAETERSLDAECLSVQGDVQNLADLDRLFVETQSRFGRIDTLVANAGGLTVEPFAEVSEASFDQQLDTNFKGLFFTVQKALPLLVDGATVVLVSSVAGVKGIPGMSVYGAAKAAVRALGRSLASELAPRGIRVNTLSPGPIETPIFTRMGMSEEEVAASKAAFTPMVPLGRYGEADEMANVVAFLASQESSFITGIELTADGGLVQV